MILLKAFDEFIIYLLFLAIKIGSISNTTDYTKCSMKIMHKVLNNPTLYEDNGTIARYNVRCNNIDMKNSA